MAAKKKATTKHIPLRSCIACHAQRAKQELIRVVRTPEGTIVIDGPKGKTSGRGAYLCPATACMELALKKKALARVLEIAITSEQLNSIKDGFIARLLELQDNNA
jgi:hypothetical protein